MKGRAVQVRGCPVRGCPVGGCPVGGLVGGCQGKPLIKLVWDASEIGDAHIGDVTAGKPIGEEKLLDDVTANEGHDW
ncbi:hypothetical protein O3P69_005656 [Scylla paramamosain]|uniref:Uncharacterized protein n=1 Tax=Scylla paramamosain TaxID=85552 RepID=A0AAW0UA69_SCYPA